MYFSLLFLCELANSSTPPLACFSLSHCVCSKSKNKTKNTSTIHFVLPVCSRSYLTVHSVKNCSIAYIISRIWNVPRQGTLHDDLLSLLYDLTYWDIKLLFAAFGSDCIFQVSLVFGFPTIIQRHTSQVHWRFQIGVCVSVCLLCCLSSATKTLLMDATIHLRGCE